jgi:hypothetical protein
MGHSIVVVDAFSDRPFAGNPAAVCLLNQPAEEHWMQLVVDEPLLFVISTRGRRLYRSGGRGE